MTTLIEEKVTNSSVLNQISIQQLTELAINSQDDSIKLAARNELIERGKDNISNRIQIKKLCKSKISDLELVLKEDDGKTNKVTKPYKGKFLNTLSVLDKLELEWQRFDFGFKN